MLALTVKDHDTVVIADGLIILKVVRIRGKIKLVFDAPPEVKIDRLHIYEARKKHPESGRTDST